MSTETRDKPFAMQFGGRTYVYMCVYMDCNIRERCCRVKFTEFGTSAYKTEIFEHVAKIGRRRKQKKIINYDSLRLLCGFLD